MTTLTLLSTSKKTESIYFQNESHPIHVYSFETEQPYLKIWHAMQEYTQHRTQFSTDQVWILQHEPVFTQGRTGKAEHLLNPGHIPVIHTDRGGQVTYHGPGQLIAYFLFDLSRRNWSIRHLIHYMENSIISVLNQYDITAYAKPEAPGVYIQKNQKIASLGLRVKRQCSFHGLSINVDLNLEPFKRINPCGFSTIEMVQLSTYVPHVDIMQIKKQLELTLMQNFSLLLGIPL
ncbi:MAG: lipoyl(octanoyl) transferase LipB [Endozoicomonadaceae bacterium]|nr:lipoyl(octanoyl) transferase LipB [Endozoicomonadaceae bacterium]